MQRKFLASAVATAVASLISLNASAIVISPTTNGNTLASAILGSGITASNISYTGFTTASGTFTGGTASGLGFDTGIIMTSGNANLAPGPNDTASAGLDNTAGPDADLDALVPGSVFDAAVLEFDFISAGGDLFFNYFFASEEYNEWLGFNDVFAFLLDGVNIALVPGTTTPVSVSNVNCGASGVDLSGPNCGYFNNNPNGSAGLQYDGFTDVFTATALGLSAGLHHIKLAIADQGDGVLDSAVFLQAGSFSDTPPVTTVPEPGTVALLGLGLLGLAAARRRKV